MSNEPERNPSAERIGEPRDAAPATHEDAVDLFRREFGTRVVGEYETDGDEIPDEYGGGTWGDVPVHEREREGE